MGKRAHQQEARRAARRVISQRQRAREEQERRLGDAAVRVMVAVKERDAAVAACEQRAGEALATMIDAEGLSAREASTWFGEVLSVRETARLYRHAHREDSPERRNVSSGVSASSDAGARPQPPTASEDSRPAP